MFNQRLCIVYLKYNLNFQLILFMFNLKNQIVKIIHQLIRPKKVNKIKIKATHSSLHCYFKNYLK